MDKELLQKIKKYQTSLAPVKQLSYPLTKSFSIIMTFSLALLLLHTPTTYAAWCSAEDPPSSVYNCSNNVGISRFYCVASDTGCPSSNAQQTCSRWVNKFKENVTDWIYKSGPKLKTSGTGELICSFSYQLNHSPNTFEQEVSLGVSPNACSPVQSELESGLGCNSRNSGPTMCLGNPINPLAGVKLQVETDLLSANVSPLKVERYYSQSIEGARWRFSYQHKALFVEYTDQAGGLFVSVILDRANGTRHEFLYSVATGAWSGDPDTGYSLTIQYGTEGVISGIQVKPPNNVTELYDLKGQLVQLKNISGHEQNLIYTESSGYISKITVTHSESSDTHTFYLQAAQNVTSVETSEGIFTYTYNNNGMLGSVIYPDATPNNTMDNPKRIYHYENVSYPKALTGITDETGNRFATWAYDAQGKAVSSEHANGTEKVTLDYTYLENAADPRVTATNELGKQTTYHYTTLHGVRKVTQVEGHQSANCAAANQSYTYDTNGFKNLVTDWEGNVTDYDHDARGLEVKRIEAKGTPQQRTITTQWHSSFRLPVKITEPDRVIDLSYDANGLLLERKETPVP